MARHFNGAYSVRAGYHGVRKSRPSAYWSCSQGHINEKQRLIDERGKGGFVHAEQVRECSQCGEPRPSKESEA